MQKNGSKYLVFGFTGEKKEVLKSTQNFWMGLKMRLRQLMMVKKVL